MSDPDFADDELTPASSDDEEEIEEAAEQVEKSMTLSIQQDVGTMEVFMSRYQDNIDVESFQSVSLDESWSRAISDPLEDYSGSDPDSQEQYQALSDKLDALLKKNADATEAKTSNLKKYLAVGLAVVLPAGAALIYELVTRFAHGQSGDGVPALTDDEKQEIENAVAQWGTISDSAYWTNVFNFAQQNSLTNADLVFFMQYTQQVFPLKTPFIWNSLADKVNVTNGLVAKANEQGGDPLQVVAQLEAGLDDGHGRTVPRALAAGCASTALAWLASPATLAQGM